MKKNNLLIVTSHFNEDLDWLINQDNYDYVIYSKNKNNCINYPKNKIFDCINKGREASSYLTYIIQNYDKLPDYIAFIHGHEYSYHQTDTTLNLIKNAKYCDYESINRKDYRNVLNNFTTNENLKKNWDLVINNFNELKIDLPEPQELIYTACAQFIVSKKMILSNSLQIYQNLLDWLYETKLECSSSGRIMEHLWHYIMTHNEIEK